MQGGPCRSRRGMQRRAMQRRAMKIEAGNAEAGHAKAGHADRGGHRCTAKLGVPLNKALFEMIKVQRSFV